MFKRLSCALRSTYYIILLFGTSTCNSEEEVFLQFVIGVLRGTCILVFPIGVSITHYSNAIEMYNESLASKRSHFEQRNLSSDLYVPFALLL